jgi:predicted NUDIX family NTP pyrophosphohydrolase
MPRRSAGLLCYRRVSGSLEVLLVHPGGPFWSRRDDGAWTIPKGEVLDDEAPLEAAVREFREETGHKPDGTFVALEPIRQTGGKLVLAWAFEGDLDPSSISSNTFSIEWPPRSGRHRTFPEVDRAAWFPVSRARTKILSGQVGLLDQLESRLAEP